MTTAIPVRIWDLPTRLFHVGLAVGVTAAIVTAKLGGDWMAWHLRCGEAVMALLLFRWAWGFAGGRWSRLRTIVPTPARVGRALRGRATAADGIGHGALGSLSVWAFLLLLSLQVATGLVADDDIATTGPLNAHVAGHLAKRASGWHAGWGADLILALIGLHVLAIGWYTLRLSAPLLRAMWTGDKPLPPETPASRDDLGRRLLALVLVVAASGCVWALVRWAG
ncbi:MAG: cytochrome b/b6 domain-containing protein [Caulobacter sp.]|nr:cytochrome b/b6 domain-containing protein [Vitreoscilla sp.]